VAPVGAAVLSVGIYNYEFSPGQVSVTGGQTVSLSVLNSDGFPHTFTVDGVVDLGPVSPGSQGETEFVAPAAGSYVFYCRVHGASTMSGQLVVS
jgi:plastocyanin